MKFELSSLPATLKASSASPPEREPSPMIATIFSFLPRMSLPFARPKASAIEVEVCPMLKKSCSLSSGFV